MMRPVRVAIGFLLVGAAAAAQQYVISTVAGGAPPPVPVAADASIGNPFGVATDSSGNVYFTSVNCVFKLDANGVLTRVAGNSRAGYSGDGGPATDAQLNFELPGFGATSDGGLALDRAGNLYIRDSFNFNGHIRKVAPNGTITTAVGGGAGDLLDGNLATSGQPSGLTGVAVDSAGGLYFADSTTNRVRKVSPEGIVTTVAGNGRQGYSGDGGPAISAQLNYPWGLAFDGADNLYITDTNNGRIRKVAPNGFITTVAGGGSTLPADGVPANAAQFHQPTSVAVDNSGNLYITGNDYRVFKVSSSAIIITVAGGGTSIPGDGGLATNARLSTPYSVAADGTGNIYITELVGGRIRKVSANGIITTVAGNGILSYSGDGGPATAAQLNSPSAVAVDGSGNYYILDPGNSRVRQVSTAGTITTVAGNGTSGSSGDGGAATSAQLYFPHGVAVDGAGILYIADWGAVRKVSPNGIITTIAGLTNGSGGGIVVDGAGSLYVADANCNQIRKLSSSGVITTLAGRSCDDGGFSGDGGPATDAQLNGPLAIAVDNAGNLYFEDWYNGRIRKVSADGIITTVVGGGAGDLLDGNLGTSGQPGGLLGLAVDRAGSLYFQEFQTRRVRKVTPDGIVTTIAGNGTRGYSGDGGPATNAQLNPGGAAVNSLAVDSAGNVYVADGSNNAVRLLRPAGPVTMPPAY